MSTKKTHNPKIKEIINRVRFAFENDKLSSYKPLVVSGFGHIYSTCPTSWGPMMKR